MAKRGGRLHQPTAEELKARRRRDDKKKADQKSGSGCGCKGGLIGPPGKKHPCPVHGKKPSNDQPTRRKPKSKSSGAGVEPRWGSR